jgi:hypothetical protein
MKRPMRQWLAACAAIWMAATGCGGGITPNPGVSPQINSTPPATAIVGVPYNYIVTARGMTPMTFAKVSGPRAFEIHPTSGVVSWAPTASGRQSIEIRVSNLAGTDTQSFEVMVEGPSGPVFTTEPPTEAAVAAPYAYDPMVVAEGDVSWSAPRAPAGLTIDMRTGAVRWTPTVDQVGDRAVTIRATEAGTGLSTDQEFVVTVVETGGPAVITSIPPERVFQGEVWTYDAAAAGAPIIEWSVVTPSSGTPATGVAIVTEPPRGPGVTIQWDTSGVSPGAYTIAVEVNNGLGDPDVQELTVTVEQRPPIPEIDVVTVPPPATVFVGSAYTYDVNLIEGTDSAGVEFSLVGPTVPADLAITVNPETGEVAFTASQSNGEIQYAYTVRAENILGEGDEETITVDAIFAPAAPVLTVMPDTVFTLEVGESFTGASATATGNPKPTLSISGTVPDFLDFDPSTGLLSASSAKPAPETSDIGSYSFDIVATNTQGVAFETIEIDVVAAPPGVDSITPAAGRRQSDVPIVVRGRGFVRSASPMVRLELGDYSESLVTTFIDEDTLSAVVPTDSARPSGVYDVVVDQGSTTTLSKRFTVTEGDGSTLSGSIATDLTLTALESPHVVTGDVRIENGATVTLEPGAVVMFAGDSNLRMDVGASSPGALIADGGEPGVGEQIVFTRFQGVGATAPSGHYRGLRFGNNNIASVTRLRNVIVEFGGRRNVAAEQGAIEILAGSAPAISDSIIRESLNYGVYAQAGAGTQVTNWFDRNQVTVNGRGPISIGSDDVSTLGANLELTENGVDRVFVRGAGVRRAASVWANYGIPYYLSAGLVVRGGATLTLAPGSELRFAQNTRLQVSVPSSGADPARLVATGTPEAPIWMVADATPWNGVFIENDAQAGTVLRNVRVEGFSGASTGGLRIDPAEPVVIVENCVFQSVEAGATGVFAANNATVGSFENNVLNVRGLSIDAPLAVFGDLLVRSSVYEAPLRVRAGSADGLMDWSKPVATDGSVQPIRPDGDLMVDQGVLTIAAGNRIEMPLNAQLSVIDGQLVVDGTPDEPVIFEPATGVDYWHRIRIRGMGGTGVSRISSAVLDSAGGNPMLGPWRERAAIVVESNSGVAATPAVSDTAILDSNGYGITFADGTHCGGACTGNTITGSRFSPLRIFANYVGRFGDENVLTGNNTTGTFGHDGVWVVGDVVDNSATWPAYGVPYVIEGNIELRQSYPLDPIPVMTIEAGAELKFFDAGGIRVGDGNEGVLDAQGTAADPIVFTSVNTTTPVFWRGIDFAQGADGSILDNVVVSYGGERAGTGNVNFRMGSVVTLGAGTLSHSEEYAAVIFDGSAPMFRDPPSDRVYERNGQASNPGPGDPAFDCVRDARTGVCSPL